MNICCPTCGSNVNINDGPTRMNRNGCGDAWLCLKCPSIICVSCYHEHTVKQHNEMVKNIKKRK